MASAPTSRIRCCAGWSRMRSGWQTSRASSPASCFTAEAIGRRPRPPARSGWVTTRVMSCPASRKCFRVGRANAAVPAKTMRNRGSGADEFRFLVLLLRFDLAQRIQAGQAVGEENAVQVIDFVLDGARQQGVALDLDRLAVAVEATRDHLHI